MKELIDIVVNQYMINITINYCTTENVREYLISNPNIDYFEASTYLADHWGIIL